MEKVPISVLCILFLTSMGLFTFPEGVVSQNREYKKLAKNSSTFLKKLEKALSNRIDEYKDNPNNKWGTWMSNMKERFKNGKSTDINQLPLTEKMRLLYLYHDYRIDQLENEANVSEKEIKEEEFKREFARLTLEVERKIYKLQNEFNLNLKTKGKKGEYGEVYERAKKIKERLIRKTVRRSSKSGIISSLNTMIGEAKKAEEEKLLEQLKKIRIKVRGKGRDNLTFKEKEVISVSMIRKKILNKEKPEVKRGRIAGRLLKIRNLRKLISYLEGLRSLSDKQFIREVSSK